jgi:hypothetical protein
MAPGALPRPGKVPEQRLLSPEICLRRRRRCRTILGKTPTLLVFSVGRLFMVKGHHQEWTRVVSPQVGTTRGWAAPPHREASLWPPLGSSSVLVLRPGKIVVWVFSLSNSENISCVAFLKHKTSENRELALWHLVSMLVPEITLKMP